MTGYQIEYRVERTKKRSDMFMNKPTYLLDKNGYIDGLVDILRI